MAVANIQVGNWMLIDPVIPYQSIIANPENRAIANGRYPVHRWFKWKLHSALFVPLRQQVKLICPSIMESAVLSVSDIEKGYVQSPNGLV